MDYKEKDIWDRIHKMYDDMDEAGKSKVERVFPEIKESEDERIRKEMIFYFTEEIPQCSIQEHSDKMRVFISWLKRQEIERTKLELKAGNSYFCYKSRWERADSETFKKGLIYKCNKDGVLNNFVIKNPEQHFIEIKDERIAWLEKQSTPQVRTGLEWVNTIDDACDKRYSEEYAHGEYCHEQSFKWGFQEGVDWLEKQAEQNSAIWSEEDEINLNYITRVIERLYDKQEKNYLKESLERKINWLRTLKDRVQPQPKQECSKEDESCYTSIMEHLKYSITNGKPETYTSGRLTDWIENRIKSLRPKSHWKPSEEQIKVCKEVYADILSAKGFDLGTVNSELNRLEEELKKLKA